MYMNLFIMPSQKDNRNICQEKIHIHGLEHIY